MALKNLQTGQSIEQETLPPEQAPNPIVKRAKEEREITLRQLDKRMQEQIERLIEIQHFIENCSEMQKTSKDDPAESETEDAARLAEIFDRYCKRIVQQHLIDARKQADRLNAECERAMKRIVKYRRLQTLSCVCSILSAVAVVVIVLMR